MVAGSGLTALFLESFFLFVKSSMCLKLSNFMILFLNYRILRVSPPSLIFSFLCSF